MMNRLKHIALPALLLAGACTVQPLYAPQATEGQTIALTALPVAIEAAGDRIELEVRERLLFRLGNGRDPETASNRLSLDVRAATAGLFRVSGSSTGQTTAATTTVTILSNLVNASDGAVVKRFRAVATTSFDKGSQEFANERAQRDAEFRAARAAADDLATQVRAYLATNG